MTCSAKVKGDSSTSSQAAFIQTVTVATTTTQTYHKHSNQVPYGAKDSLWSAGVLTASSQNIPTYAWVNDKPAAGDACLLSQACSGLLEGGCVVGWGVSREGEGVKQGSEKVVGGAHILAILSLDAT